MVEVAKVSDIQELSIREATKLQRKLLGVTITEPRYVEVPEEGAPGAVFEFLADVHVLSGPSQAVIPGNVDALTRLNNVLVAHEAVGELVADIHIPVEMELLTSGQLQITGRAKVALPSLVTKGYNYNDLGLFHLSDLQSDGNGGWIDPFHMPANADLGAFGSVVSKKIDVTTRLSTLQELTRDDVGNVVPLGTNVFQRTIIEHARTYELVVDETVRIDETLEEA